MVVCTRSKITHCGCRISGSTSVAKARNALVKRLRIVPIYDYVLGGGHNFKVDREAAERLLAAVPARDMAQLNRGFLHRAVLFLIDAGIRQFLDLGSGIPTVGNAPETHRLLDLAQPLDLRMVGVLQFVPDSDDPWGVVASHREKLAPGSYRAVSHFTPDGMPERMAQAVEVFTNTQRSPAPSLVR